MSDNAYLDQGEKILQMTDKHFFPKHCTYFCVRCTDGAARIYFSSLLSLPERVTLLSRIIPVHVREREVRRKKKKKKAQKKTLGRDWDLNPQTLSPEPIMLSVRPRRPAPDDRQTQQNRNHGSTSNHEVMQDSKSQICDIVMWKFDIAMRTCEFGNTDVSSKSCGRFFCSTALTSTGWVRMTIKPRHCPPFF